MPTVVEELNASLKTKSEAMVELLDRIDGEKAPTDEQLTGWRGEVGGLEGEIKSLNVRMEEAEKRDALRAAATTAIKRVGEVPTENRLAFPGGAGVSPRIVEQLRGGTLGAHFANSDAYKNWLGSVSGGGPIPESTAAGRLQNSNPVPVPGSLKTLLPTIYESFEAVKALVTSQTAWAVPSHLSGSALVQPDFRGLVDMGTWMRPLRILDLIARETTSSDVIYFARSTGSTQAATPVAEATASSGSSGVKPEGGLTFELAQALVRTIAVWTAVSRQAAADATGIMQAVDEYLRYDLALELEDQVISGSGSGQNFTGIRNQTGVLTQAYVTGILTTTRKAVTNLLLNGRVVPTGWVFHPSDWETIDLLADNENRYYLGGPVGQGTPVLWGIPVTQSEAATAGEAILGFWRMARLVDREQTTIRVSDSHADFWIRNLLSVLAELRAAFYVSRPSAFVKVDLTA